MLRRPLNNISSCCQFRAVVLRRWLAQIPLWALTSAGWRVNGQPGRRRKPRRAARSVRRFSQTLVATWNARQEGHMPMLFSPTIGAAIKARVPMDSLSGLSHHDRSICAHSTTPRRGRDKPDPGPVVSLVPPQRAVRTIARSVVEQRGGRTRSTAFGE